MTNEPTFKMSQDYEILPPKKQRAYPIQIEEWVYLKTRIKAIRDDANLYHTIGSIFLGVAGSALVAALTLDLPKQTSGAAAMPIVYAWFTFTASLACGGLCLWFGKSQRDSSTTNANDVVSQMEIIEKRYEVSV